MIRPIQDGVPFIESLEQSVSEGNVSHIKANEERIIALIEKLQDRCHELALLQQRARQVLEAIEGR